MRRWVSNLVSGLNDLIACIAYARNILVKRHAAYRGNVHRSGRLRMVASRIGTAQRMVRAPVSTGYASPGKQLADHSATISESCR